MIAISCYIQECAACSPVPAELDLFYCFIQRLCSDLPSETILHCSSRSALTNDTMQHCGLHSALSNATCTAYIVAYIMFYHVVLYLSIHFVTDFSYVFCYVLITCIVRRFQRVSVCVCPIVVCLFITTLTQKTMINCDFFHYQIAINVTGNIT